MSSDLSAAHAGMGALGSSAFNSGKVSWLARPCCQACRSASRPIGPGHLDRRLQRVVPIPLLPVQHRCETVPPAARSPCGHGKHAIANNLAIPTRQGSLAPRRSPGTPMRGCVQQRLFRSVRRGSSCRRCRHNLPFPPAGTRAQGTMARRRPGEGELEHLPLELPGASPARRVATQQGL